MKRLAESTRIGLENLADLVADTSEGIHFRFTLECCFGRVLKSPVMAADLAWKHRAGLVRVVADRNDHIDTGIQILVKVLGCMR